MIDFSHDEVKRVTLIYGFCFCHITTMHVFSCTLNNEHLIKIKIKIKKNPGFPSHEPSPLHLRRLKSQHHGKSSSPSTASSGSPTMALAPAFCLGVLCYRSPSSLLWLWPTPPGGSCSRSSLTPAHEVRFSPFSPLSRRVSLSVGTVGKTPPTRQHVGLTGPCYR